MANYQVGLINCVLNFYSEQKILDYNADFHKNNILKNHILGIYSVFEYIQYI